MSTLDDLFDPRRLGPLWERVHEEEEERRKQEREEERSEKEEAPPLLAVWSDLERAIVRELGPRAGALKAHIESGRELVIEQVGTAAVVAAVAEVAPAAAEPAGAEPTAAPEDAAPSISLAKLGSEGGFFYRLNEAVKVARGLEKGVKERLAKPPLEGGELEKNKKSLGAVLDEIEDLYEAMKLVRR